MNTQNGHNKFEILKGLVGSSGSHHYNFPCPRHAWNHGKVVGEVVIILNPEIRGYSIHHQPIHHKKEAENNVGFSCPATHISVCVIL
jgi:hypothetical protein